MSRWRRRCRPTVIHAVKQQRYADEAKRLVFLTGCYLDDPATLRAVTAIFHGYEHLEEGPPAMFVFIGPFFRAAAHSKAPMPDSHTTQAAFHSLAAAISLFPSIQVHLPTAPARAPTPPWPAAPRHPGGRLLRPLCGARPAAEGRMRAGSVKDGVCARGE